MDTIKSIQIIENMINETKKSLRRNSHYFILWGILMALCGIIETLLIGITQLSWIVWPLASAVGGIIATFLGKKENKEVGTKTAVDRITNYTWGAFAFALLFSIAYALYNGLNPHALILMLAGFATFISGGILKFNPFIYGGIALELGAIACAFFVPNEFHGYAFSISIILGYVIPGVMLRRIEHEQA